MRKQALIATKVGMTQLFLEDGVVVPVTVLSIEDNIVIKKKINEKDGYNAVMLGTGSLRPKLLNKPTTNFFAKINIEPKKHLKEFRLDESVLSSYEEGKPAPKDWLSGKDISLDISGISKGKGFAGVMKRHNFGGHRATHGSHETFRGPGSIGMREHPGKVLKGHRMAGHMGDESVTVKNIRVIKWIEEEGILCVRGGLPGAKGSLLKIRLSNRKAKAIKGVSGPKEEKGLKNPMKASKAAAGAKGKK